MRDARSLRRLYTEKSTDTVNRGFTGGRMIARLARFLHQLRPLATTIFIGDASSHAYPVDAHKR